MEEIMFLTPHYVARSMQCGVWWEDPTWRYQGDGVEGLGLELTTPSSY